MKIKNLSKLKTKNFQLFKKNYLWHFTNTIVRLIEMVYLAPINCFSDSPIIMRNKMQRFKTVNMFWFAGGLDARRGPDHPDAAHQGGDAQFAHLSFARQPAHLESAHPPGEGGRPRLLHVSDQHQRDEEANRLRRRARWVCLSGWLGLSGLTWLGRLDCDSERELTMLWRNQLIRIGAHWHVCVCVSARSASFAFLIKCVARTARWVLGADQWECTLAGETFDAYWISIWIRYFTNCEREYVVAQNLGVGNLTLRLFICYVFDQFLMLA